MENFEKEYKRLNDAQKKAVDTIEGPVMVIAGPGTGKTSILTLRIANILKETDTNPENILALTFTESGVNAMRKKLTNLIGSRGYKVNIYTFHSFASDIIKRYPEYFDRIIGSSNASDIDQIRIIEGILDEKDYDYLKTYGDPYYYLHHIIKEIQNLKREGITPLKYKEYAYDLKKQFEGDDDNFNKEGKVKSAKLSSLNKIKRNIELVEVYTKYQDKLVEEKLIDFEDMILELVDALSKNEELLLILQEEYQYILADEHQDTNNAQNSVLELLSSFHQSPNLFIVGDEKQAIFRFQGASLENFLYFKSKYKDSTLITLINNYRSTQSILDNAHNVILNNKVKDQSLRERLLSFSGGEKPIDVCQFSNTDFENMYIVNSLKEKIKEGVSLDEIAILYRNNKDVFEIARYLEKADIPYVVHSDQDLLSHPDVSKIISLLKVIYNLTDDISLSKVLHIDFLNLNPFDVHKIIYSSKTYIFNVISDEKKLEELGVLDIDGFIGLSQTLNELVKSSRNDEILLFVEKVMHKSGLLKSILSNSVQYERLRAIEAFFAEVRKIVEGKVIYTLEDLLNHFDILKKYNIRIKFNPSLLRSGVRLMTAHRSKGLEFDYVYILGATNKSWDKKGFREYFESPLKRDTLEEKNGDERRLFYVALTRARKHVSITSSKQNASGDNLLPTSFIDELDQGLVQYIETKDMEEEFQTKLEDKFVLKEKEVNEGHKEYLNNLFLERGFSVTALNNYLKCPWRYFYSNLIRLPQAYSKHQKYGTAIHAALNDFFNKYKENEESEEYLLSQFIYYLKRSSLNDVEYEELMKKGKVALSGYFNTYEGTWKRDILNEYKVHSIFDIGGREITLTGALDKVEFNSESHINVVDYKTSTPKSRNEIKGKTKGSTGDYMRQLIFYKLLIELFDDKRFILDSAEIDFVEPNTTGKFKKEKFEISDDQVEELAEVIRNVSNEILGLEFWNKRCDDVECEYCNLRE